MAGLRAGTVLAADGVIRRLRGKNAEDANASRFAKKEARRLVEELGRLKGTYVKVGQMMALFGEHFLPSVLTEALHHLDTNTEPLPWDQIKPLLDRDLGHRADELEIDPSAIAAASLAQVHRACIIATGEQICLKIQYPGLAEVIDADFDAVVRLLKLAQWLPAGRDFDDWLCSLREHLHNEIDYHREAAIAREIRQYTQVLDRSRLRLAVPQVYSQYSGSHVLALEYIDGYRVGADYVQALPLKIRNELGSAMLDLFFIELFDWGLIQTDPNFGNYLIRTTADGEELVLLDFGSVLRPEQRFLEQLCRVIVSGLAGDEEEIVDGLIGLGCLSTSSEPEARQLFLDFCEHLLEPLQSKEKIPASCLNADGHYQWATSGLMNRAAKKAAENAMSRHFTVPGRDFALITRKLSGVFTFIAVLNAEFDGAAIAQRYCDGGSGSV